MSQVSQVSHGVSPRSESYPVNQSRTREGRTRHAFVRADCSHARATCKSDMQSKMLKAAGSREGQAGNLDVVVAGGGAHELLVLAVLLVEPLRALILAQHCASTPCCCAALQRKAQHLCATKHARIEP